MSMLSEKLIEYMKPQDLLIKLHLEFRFKRVSRIPADKIRRRTYIPIDRNSLDHISLMSRSWGFMYSISFSESIDI